MMLSEMFKNYPQPDDYIPNNHPRCHCIKPLEIMSGETTTHTFEIKGEQFGNTTITGGITGLSNAEYSYTDDQGNVIKNVPEIPTGKTVSAKFDCVKNKTYWIKVNPSAGVTTVKANSIKIGKNQ